MGVRPSQHIAERRLAEVYALLLAGFTRWQILERTREWGINEAASDEYIKKARQCLQEINKPTFEEDRAHVLGALWDIYRRASSKDLLSEMRGALKQIAAICGLEELTVRHVIDELPQVMDAEVIGEIGARSLTEGDTSACH